MDPIPTPAPKPWYMSTTVWFNVLAILIGVATQFDYGNFVPAEWADQVVLLIVTGVNLALRVFKTAGAIR